MALIRFEQESRLHAEERAIKENKKVKVLAEGEEILSFHGQRFIMVPLSLKRTIFIAEGYTKAASIIEYTNMPADVSFN